MYIYGLELKHTITILTEDTKCIYLVMRLKITYLT